jgi:hypothetical protein
VDPPGHQGALGVRDQRPQALVPPVEVLEDGLLGDLGVGEVDPVQPLLGRLHRRVHMQAAVALPVGEEAPARAEREQRAAADDLGAHRMPYVRVRQVRLHERDPGVRGRRVREQRAHP